MSRTLPFFSCIKSRFSQYIFTLLLKRLALLTFAGVLLIWTIQSLHFVGLIAAHGMNLKKFFELTVLLLPTFINVILPLSTFAVILFTYERLAADRELTILQGSGLSPIELSFPALSCACLSMLLAYGLTFFVIPASYHAFHKQEFRIKNDLAGLFLEEGVFNHLPNDMTIYIQKKEENAFSGALIEQKLKSGERTILMAESGSLIHTDDGLKILLQNGSRQKLNKNDKTLSFLGFGKKIIHISPPMQAVHYKDAQEFPFFKLFHPPDALPQAVKGKFYVEGFERLASPLYCLAFAMIALSWILCGPPRLDRKIYTPVIAAIISSAALLGSNLLLRSFTTLNPSLSFLLLCLPAIPIFIALFVLFTHSRASKLLPPAALL